MRIFVSSSFEDLREHRAAAIRVLRQLGHEVLAMEDMIAGSAAPLAKVLEMVDRSEAYVGIFAWRYGYVPTQSTEPDPPAAINIPVVDRAVYGETSITHYEYLRAVQRKLPVMASYLTNIIRGRHNSSTDLTRPARKRPRMPTRSALSGSYYNRNGSCRGLPPRATWKRV